MEHKRVSEREERFCLFYRRTGNGKEAALAAGYPPRSAERTALSLLGEKRIKKRLAALAADEATAEQELLQAGARRLAFGSVNDAVRLALDRENISPEELPKLDLFALSELKVTDKGLEMKFFDRLKALSLLRELCGSGSDEEKTSFYDALERSAAALQKREALDE